MTTLGHAVLRQTKPGLQNNKPGWVPAFHPQSSSNPFVGYLPLRLHVSLLLPRDGGSLLNSNLTDEIRSLDRLSNSPPPASWFSFCLVSGSGSAAAKEKGAFPMAGAEYALPY